ncbi:hypothetical protein F4803DRAFT_553006 [Xylaria telfairii]|nr:hypothetical protein F4803DRAFT_553006 [Xylaria telfairii]
MDNSPVSCWDELASSLNAIKCLESFSSIKTYPSAVNPVIQVNERVIALPLTELGAEIIKHVGGHVNAKDGSQTAIATSVWELDAENFDILSPDWPSFLKVILDDACEGLGLTGFVDAKPYKLCLCEQDGFPHWQNKTSEMEGMVATLAIYLPSAHLGGVIQLSHAGKHRSFDISERSMFATRVVAWSTNTGYKAEQIVSGRRLTLIYRVVDKCENQNSTNNVDNPIGIVAQELRQCMQQAPNFSPKIYRLDHQYPRGELLLNTLKGHDYAVCKALKDLSSRHGFYLLLGHSEKRPSALDDPEMDSDTETDGGTYIYSGSDVDSEIDIDEDSDTGENSAADEGNDTGEGGSTEEDNNADEDIHTEDYHAEENTVCVDLMDGMNGMEVAKNMISAKSQVLNDPYREDRITSSGGSVFSNSIAVICPKVHLASYLDLPQTTNLENIIQMVMRDIDDRADTHRHPEDSLRVLEEIVDCWHGSKLPSSVRSKVVQWAWDNQYQTLFVKILSSEMNLRIELKTISTIAQIINADISQDTELIGLQWGKYFNGVFHPAQNLKNITLSLNDIENRMVDGLKSSFRAWKRTIQQHLFRSNISLEWDDIRYFLESVVPNTEHSDWVLSCLVPVLRNPTRKHLLRKSIYGLLGIRPQLTVHNFIDIAEQIILCTYQNAALDIADFQVEQYSQSPASLFADLVDKGLCAGLRTAVFKLLDASWTNMISHHASRDASPLMGHEVIIKGFLTQLAFILPHYAFPHIYSTGAMFKLLIRRYIYAAAPLYPRKLRGWEHRPRGCGCRICTQLDTFLQSKYSTKEDFVVRDISHLKSRLPRGLIRCVHRPTEATTTSKVYRLHKIEGKEFELDVEHYNEEVSTFEQYFKMLRNEYMEKLFGKVSYRELIMLEYVKNSEGQKKLTGAATTGGKKRKAGNNWGNGNRAIKIFAIGRPR